MNLFEILACPTCKVRVTLQGNVLKCEQCGLSFPIVNGVPVMFPDGSIPEIQHEAELDTRDSYGPWVHRVILQSLLDDQIVVEIGAGNRTLDDPCIIRMDVKLSPHVDLVADVHSMPFLPESVDYIFSLAVVEHLRDPFRAAREIYFALNDGGYVYHECNFVCPYHGYPHHYFNLSLQGMEQVFSQFVPLRKGVATYQMPSFALDSVIRTYLKFSQAEKYVHGRRLTSMLRQIIDQNLMEHDIYFSEEGALNVAAGTYFAGMKQSSPYSSLLHSTIQEAWRSDKDLQKRFPNINELTTVDNILVWAKREGRNLFPEIAEYLDSILPFNKRGPEAGWIRDYIHSLEFQEPPFGAIGFDAGASMHANAQVAESRYQTRSEGTIRREHSLIRRGMEVLRKEGIKSIVYKLRNYLLRKFKD